jgi:hypothetical protein
MTFMIDEMQFSQLKRISGNRGRRVGKARSRFRLFTRIVAALFLGLLPLVGCGRATNAISGKVTFRGLPLASGAVTLSTSENQTYRTAIQADGSYHIQGVPGGVMSITVESPRPAAVAPLPKPNNGAMVDALPAVDAAKWFAIPDRYGRAGQSGLNCTVGSGVTTYDIELK